LSGGSKKPVEFAKKHNKVCLHLHARQQDAAQRLHAFLEENVVETLNVAGPRASKEPNVAQFVIKTLYRVFGPFCSGLSFAPAKASDSELILGSWLNAKIGEPRFGPRKLRSK
jgi:Circularly permutated YpsA SLOG family